jgi:hypothetical protein
LLLSVEPLVSLGLVYTNISTALLHDQDQMFLMTSRTDETWATIPGWLGLITSVAMARMKPNMAARPFSCSEKAVNPCGTWGNLEFLGSMAMRVTTAAGLRATTAVARRPVKDDVATEVEVEVGRTAETLTKAILILRIRQQDCTFGFAAE